MQPNLVSGHEIGRDRDEWNVEILDAERSEQSSQLRDDLRALDHAAAPQIKIEIADNLASIERESPFLEPVELPGEIASADQRAGRATRHDIEGNADTRQGANSADVRPTPRDAAAQRKPHLVATRHTG